MNRLFKLKKWLTIPEAARHLAIVFGEEVSESDVLRLALDGHLKLSVNFANHAKARRGKVIPLSEANTAPGLYREGEEPYQVVLALRLNERDFLELDERIATLDGILDLPFVGNEQLDVEYKYQQLTDGPAVTLQGLDGAFSEGEGGERQPSKVMPQHKPASASCTTKAKASRRTISRPYCGIKKRRRREILQAIHRCKCNYGLLGIEQVRSGVSRLVTEDVHQAVATTLTAQCFRAAKRIAKRF